MEVRGQLDSDKSLTRVRRRGHLMFHTLSSCATGLSLERWMRMFSKTWAARVGFGFRIGQEGTSPKDAGRRHNEKLQTDVQRVKRKILEDEQWVFKVI